MSVPSPGNVMQTAQHEFAAAKVQLFLHICKKKVQFVVGIALF